MRERQRANMQNADSFPGSSPSTAHTYAHTSTHTYQANLAFNFYNKIPLF